MNTQKTTTLHITLLLLISLFLTACGGTSATNGPAPLTVKQIQQKAIDKISQYSEDGKVLPTLKDYTTAGITKVTSDNLAEINSEIRKVASKVKLNAKQKIQAVVDLFITNKIQQNAVNNISQYAEDGKIAPTLKEYNVAGVVGVTNENLAKVNLAVRKVASKAKANTKQKIQTIVDLSIDTIIPTIVLKGETSVTITRDTAFIDSGVSATDNLEGDITSKVNITGSVNNSVVGTYAVSYNVSDLAGNAATEVIREVSVIPPRSQVYINEILAANTNTAMDSDFFAFSDWIELHNSGDNSINIGGYYLSDDKDEPKLWKIPEGTEISAHGYLIIWADKEDADLKELHTNFKLSLKKGTVTLANRDGDVIDKIKYAKQGSDVSCAKINNKIVYMSPTPNAKNNNTFITKARLESPVFSFSGGFYDSVLSLTMSSNNSSIYYTTDGSLPTSKSLLYTSALKINKTTTVRAVSIKAGNLVSPSTSKTYFINHQTTLPVVSLTIDPTYLFDEKTGIYVEGDGSNGIPLDYCLSSLTQAVNYAQDWERPVHFELYDESHTSQLSFRADMSITGQCSRRYEKKSFSLKLDGKYGTKSIKNKFYENKPLKKLKDFKIRAGNYGYEIGDTLAALVVENLELDIDYQAYKTVQMFMNGEYWGIYDIREKKGEDFLKSNYPDIGDIDLIDRLKVKRGDVNDYKELMDYIDTHNLSTNSYYQYVLSKVDENSFIDYMSFNIYSGNLDWINSNHRSWKEKKEGSKWRWMIDDVDYGFKDKDINLFERLRDKRDYYLLTKLFNGLLKNETFKTKFKNRFIDLLDTKFTPSKMKELVDIVNDAQKDYIKFEKIDWGYNYDKNITEINVFIQARTEVVREQLEVFIP